MATTDLHMHLMPYDYYADQPKNGTGLAQLIPLIERLRAEAGATTLLCDNGDVLQGTPMADHLAETMSEWSAHPMITVMNTLGYDAMTLGNHEFDYGLHFLEQALSAAVFPVVSANLQIAGAKTPPHPFVILHRTVETTAGTDSPIRIGITGVAPPQIALWDKAKHGGAVETQDIVAAARAVVPQMRAAGADIVIMLCHAGLGAAEHSPGMENAAIPLATVPGIDALIMGHTHRIFPDAAAECQGPVNHDHSTIHGVPAVMPACFGQSLGVIDLELEKSAEGWKVRDHNVSHLWSDPATPPSVLPAPAAAAHDATLAAMAAPVAVTTQPIHSYFATIRPDMAQQLLADAATALVRENLKDSVDMELPVLAATSPLLLGTRRGPIKNIAIPPGPITRRNVSAICPYADPVCAVRCTGAQIRAWLERSAAHYNQLHPDVGDQPLINPDSPGYNCDTLHGLTYTFDLSQPARFDVLGNPSDVGEGRVQSLLHHGRAVNDTDIFLIVTNSFRANGGGSFPAFDSANIAYQSAEAARDVLLSFLQRLGTFEATLRPVWEFAAVPGSAATFDAAPEALDHIAEPAVPAIASIDAPGTFKLRW
ncbi:MAG: bifunctional 2',3'-cyclic-nucleotide 2'-phosphodiesterase/3'-nucleotidase [Pseudomonadota bacterium]